MHISGIKLVGEYRGFQILETIQGDVEAFHPGRRLVLSYEDSVEQMKRRINEYEGVYRPTDHPIPELA